MVIGILLTLVLALFWAQFNSSKTKEATNISFIAGICIVWITFLFMKLGEWEPLQHPYIYLIFIPIICLIIWQVYKIGDKKGIEIVAKQQNYWSIPSSKIYNHYKNRKIKKSDRIETKIDLEDKHLGKQYSHRSYFLSGNIFIDIKNLKLTKVDNIKNIHNYKLYSLIFKKIEQMIKYLEKNVDFEQILKENDMCLEYFLMDLWERYTQSFNIGTANLDVYATSEIEKELVGALDNIDLNSVKRRGSALFFSYMKFKKRLPSDLKNRTN